MRVHLVESIIDAAPAINSESPLYVTGREYPVKSTMVPPEIFFKKQETNVNMEKVDCATCVFYPHHVC